MRLLFVSESPLVLAGGRYHAGDPGIRIPLFLAEKGLEVTIWAPVAQRPSAPDGTWTVPTAGIRMEHRDGYHSFATYYRLWPRRALAWSRQAGDLIAAHDAVMVRAPGPILPILSRQARRAGRPLILIVWGDLAAQSDSLLRSGGLKRLLYAGAVDLFVRQEVACGRDAALVYVFSQDLRRRHAGTRGVLKQIQDPHLRLSDFIQREDTCRGPEIRLVRVCWLLPSKGLEFLLESVALLRGKGLPVRLEFVGRERQPGYQAELERLAQRLGIRDRVVFGGWLPFDRIGEAFLRSDIHLVSSLAEGTPRVMVEGFARGTPLVATAVNGCHEVLTHERHALLVPAADPGAMAEAVERMVRETELRRSLIRNGYELARAATFETLGEELLRDIEGVVHPGARSNLGQKVI